MSGGYSMDYIRAIIDGNKLRVAKYSGQGKQWYPIHNPNVTIIDPEFLTLIQI